MEFRLFPLLPKSKAPATSNGLYAATTDAAQLAAWKKTNPDYNWGVRTGEGLLVVDFDPAKMTAESETFLDSLPPTYIVETGSGGLHYYYTTDPAVSYRNRVGIYPGVDIRASGGYVVCPPSTHPSGGIYTELSQSDSITQIPPSLATLLLDPERQSTTLSSGDEVVTGGRNDYLAKAAGKMQRSGILTLEALLALNDQRCSPPLGDTEVTAIYESITRYAPADPIFPDNQDGTGGEGSKNSWVIRADCFSVSALDSLADKDAVYGQATGLPTLNDLLGGGYRLGELTAITAVTKVGKSSLIHQLIYNLISQGIPVGYASREMRPDKEVIPSLLSIHHQENVWKEDITAAKRTQYTESISSWPLYFSPGYGYFPLDDLNQWVESLVRLGVRYFFFDHLHYGLQDPSDWGAATRLAQQLKSLVLKHNIFTLVIIQPGKLMEGAKLSFSNMQGGAGVGQAVDSVFVLERHKANGVAVPNIAKLTLDIARHKLAKLGSLYLQYDPETTSISEAKAITVEDPEPERYQG